MARSKITDQPRAKSDPVSGTASGGRALTAAARSKVERLVEQVIADLGYVPEFATASGGADLIVLIHDGSQDEHLAAVQAGIADACTGSACLLGIRRIGPDPLADVTDLLERHRPSGIFLLPPLCDAPEIIAACCNAGTRTVCIGAHRGTIEAGARIVTFEERLGMARAVDALVALGHGRIALVSGPDGGSLTQERELGYLDAMAEHGLDRGPALVETGDFTCQSGRAAGAMLLEVSPRPTAIIAVNDAMAAGVLQAAADRKIAVPGQLSIVGFGDSPLAEQLSPSLSSVRIDWRRLARRAADRLLGNEADNAAQECDVPHLISRATIAPPG